MRKITLVFLCSSLEPGRDGVGDYTRQLASELVRKGYQITLLALNDKALTEEWIGIQKENDVEIPVFRVPATWSSTQRFERAREWINNIDPQWLSLQFSPFGFNSKGLPFGLGKYLHSLSAGRKWHIMFHELWVGLDSEATIKHIVWGWLQKRIVVTLLKKINPQTITTHTQLYQSILLESGFLVDSLPLPTNISVIQNSDSFLPAFNKSDSTLYFVIFGSIHHATPVTDFAKELSLYITNRGLAAELILIGHNGHEQKLWIKTWQDNGLGIRVMGEQPSEVISQILSKSDFGITTVPYELIGKSSSVATMQAHKLPIICVAKPWIPRYPHPFQTFSGIVEYKQGDIHYCLTNTANLTATQTLSSICDTLFQYIRAKDIKATVPPV